jgi:hypothetical protein
MRIERLETRLSIHLQQRSHQKEFSFTDTS